MRNIGRAFAKWITNVFEETEDAVAYIEIQPKSNPPSLEDIRDNDIKHLAMGMNGLHIRVGRLEAKVGLILMILVGILLIALEPIIQSIVELT